MQVMHFLTMTHRIVTKIHIFKVHFYKECTYIRSALVQIKECSYTNTFFNNEKLFQAKNYFVYLGDRVSEVATFNLPIPPTRFPIFLHYFLIFESAE